MIMNFWVPEKACISREAPWRREEGASLFVNAYRTAGKDWH
jgi:hypothetical protein